MDRIDRLLAIKTRLTTIKGYGQLLAREVSRLSPTPERPQAQIAELNREIDRLVILMHEIEHEMTNGVGATPASNDGNGDEYQSSIR